MSEYIVEFGRPINEDNEYIHEPIVRCRDCMWCSGYTTPLECFRVQGGMLVESDGFCAWASRKGGDV